ALSAHFLSIQSPRWRARVDCRIFEKCWDYAAPFVLTAGLFAASRANRSARKRAVFSRIASSLAWYSAIACSPSRACCSFLNSAWARRSASSECMLNVGLLGLAKASQRKLSKLIETVGGDFLARQICLRVS